METEGGDSSPSREESERETRLPAGEKGAGSGVCESLRRRDSAAGSRSRDKPGEQRQAQESGGADS